MYTTFMYATTTFVYAFVRENIRTYNRSDQTTFYKASFFFFNNSCTYTNDTFTYFSNIKVY